MVWFFARGFELPRLNRHLGVCRPPPVAALRCRQPAHPLVPVSKLHLGWSGVLTSLQKPPSRGMQASSGRFAPTSSARTPTRVGFHAMWVSKLLARKISSDSPPSRLAHSRAHTSLPAAPVVGASSRQHWSAATGGGRRARQRGGLSHHEHQRNWNLTPINLDVHPSLTQHRWRVRRPTTLERSDWRRAACPPAGRAQHKANQAIKLASHQNKPAQ